MSLAGEICIKRVLSPPPKTIERLPRPNFKRGTTPKARVVDSCSIDDTSCPNILPPTRDLEEMYARLWNRVTDARSSRFQGLKSPRVLHLMLQQRLVCLREVKTSNNYLYRDRYLTPEEK